MNPGMPYGRTHRPHRIGVSAYYVFTNMFFYALSEALLFLT